MDLVILIFSSGITFLLGLLVYLRDTRKRYAQVFGTMSLFICVWIVTNYITNTYSDNLSITNLANRLAYASGLCVVFSGLLFTHFFPAKRPIGKKEQLILALTATILILLSLTHFVAGSVSIDLSGRLSYSTGPMLWVYVMGFLAYVFLIIKNLLRVQGNHSIRKRQARVVLLAFSTSALLGLMLNAVIPAFVPQWHTTELGPIAPIILVAAITYAIVKHGLFDIRLAAVRSLAYVLSIGTLAVVYFLSVYTISASLLHDKSVLDGSTWINIALALVLAFLFQPVRNFFDRWTDKLFNQSDYIPEDFIARLSRTLAVPKDLRTLLEATSKDISETLKLEKAFFLVWYQHRTILAGTSGIPRLSKEDSDRLRDFAHGDAGDVVIVEALDQKHSEGLASLFSRGEIAVVLPLWQGDQLVGHLFLGEKQTGYYTKRDLKLLQAVRDELVIAIQNSLSVHEVKELNRTLHHRIEEATSELRSSNEQLKRLDAAKDEFVSMASHQLRTPLTSVKGYISMVLEGDVGEVTPAQRQLLEEAYASSERMVHLISDFLSVSRLQTGKFAIEKSPVNLAKLVKQEVDGMMSIAEAHSLKLHYRKPSYFPALYLDEGKIRQVVMNFIDNAIYYSPEHSTITVKLAVEDGSAVLTVRDSGIGVPKDQRAHLFTKFFRADNARRQRPDGTGVGLFLAKKVVVAHGGSIVFESVEGEGSTFGFRLPIKKLSQAPAEPAEPLEAATK